MAHSQLLLLLVFCGLAAALSDKGVIYLDDISFDKLVNGRDDVFVRFDKEYPWGDAHDMFKDLAVTLGEADAPLVVAGVPISNREEYMVNPRLSSRFGLNAIKDEAFPVFKLFKRGADPKKPLSYSGPIKKDDVAGWLIENTGIFIGKKGQVEALDAAAKKLFSAKASERPQLLKAAQDAATKLTLSPSQKDYVEYYIKAMQRIVEKGESYVEKESERLAKMAADKSVAAAKREVFEWKVNVLSSFAPRKAGGGKDEL